MRTMRGLGVLSLVALQASAAGAEAVAFENPDGTRVVVFAVSGENPRKRRQIQFKVDGAYHALSVPEHSITTFVLKK